MNLDSSPPQHPKSLHPTEPGTERLARLPRPWVFALSGGVASGAAQAGFLVGLVGAGFVPDGLVGMSVGSLNAAYAAWRPHPQQVRGLLDVWCRSEATTVLAGRPHRALLGNRRRIGNVLRPYEHLTFDGLSRPLSVGAVQIRSRRLRFFSAGPLIPALRASTAIPLLIGSATVDGRTYYDPSVLDTFGCTEAVEMLGRLAGRAAMGSVVLLDACRGRGRDGQRLRAIKVVTGAGLSLVQVDVGTGGPRWSFGASVRGTEAGLAHAEAWLHGRTYEKCYWGPGRRFASRG